MEKRIVLLGPPASGKGTQAEMIRARYQIEPTSTGAMLREELRKGTALGREADELTSRGNLVPDSLVIPLVGQWLSTHADAFVFDGFPRTVAQGEALQKLLQDRNTPLDVVFFFNASSDTIRHRVLHRLTCVQCGLTVSAGLDIALDETACPACKMPLSRRSDDTVEALEQRMTEYRLKTEPLVEFYKKRGLLIELSADKRPEEVFVEISSALEAA